MKKKSSRSFSFYRKYVHSDLGDENTEAIKKLFAGIIISNGILALFDIFYVFYIKITPLYWIIPTSIIINSICIILNYKNRLQLAFYSIIILNLLIFPINTILFSTHEAFYFVSVLGGIILAVHLPRLYEFIAAAIFGVIVFIIERLYFNGQIFPDEILTTHPVLFYTRSALMFMIYAYWLYLFKRNQYLHSKIIAGKDLTLLRYMTALNQSATTILITDTQGNIEYGNPQVEKSTGYHLDEIIGRNSRMFKSGKTPLDTYEQMWKQLEKGKVWKGVFVNQKKNKEEYIEQAIISPVKNTYGEIINYVAIKEDITEHLKTISELRESNEKYRQLSEQIDDIIWKIDLKTITFNYINPAVKNMLGYHPEEVINTSLKKYFTEASYSYLVQNLETYLSHYTKGSEARFRNRYQMIHKDQSLVDVEVSANFMVDDDQNPYEAHGIARDITQQLIQERELNETNLNLKHSLTQTTEEYKQLLSQLTNIFNNASNSIGFFEKKGNDIFFTSCNDRWASKIGYKPEELAGKNISDVLDKESLWLYNKFINKALNNNSPLYEELVWRDIYMYLNIFPIQDQNGKQFCLCFIYNITDKKEAEERLLETEQQFINIFRISKEGIIILKPDLSIARANESFTKMIHANDEKTIHNIVEVIPHKYIPKLHKCIKELNQGKSFCQVEAEVRTLQGEILPIEINLSLIREYHNSLVLCVIRDVSIRKNYEKKLIDSSIRIENRNRQELAHDLHDNVGPLLSSLNMCLSLLFRKPEVKKYSDDINDINRILKESISAVREISNNLSPQVLTNHGLISALEIFFETKQKLIQIDFTHSIGDLRFDPIKETMVYNVIKEVFNNTVKYSQSPNVRLSISKRFNLITITYQDFGVGFDFDEKLTPASNNLGIFSVINRLKILDGEYQIKTAPGKGFLLDLTFPI